MYAGPSFDCHRFVSTSALFWHFGVGRSHLAPASLCRLLTLIQQGCSPKAVCNQAVFLLVARRIVTFWRCTFVGSSLQFCRGSFHLVGTALARYVLSSHQPRSNPARKCLSGRSPPALFHSCSRVLSHCLLCMRGTVQPWRNFLPGLRIFAHYFSLCL